MHGNKTYTHVFIGHVEYFRQYRVTVRPGLLSFERFDSRIEVSYRKQREEIRGHYVDPNNTHYYTQKGIISLWGSPEIADHLQDAETEFS